MEVESHTVPQNVRPRLAGVILAGGVSRRMGVDKAMLRTAGRTQLESVSAVLSGIFDTVVIAVRAHDDSRTIPSGLTVVADEIPGEGPLAGIIAAHRRFPGWALFVVAVDLFGVNDLVIDAFLRARNHEPWCDVTALAVVPSASDPRPEVFPDPLCAIWEPTALRTATQAFERGERNPQVILRATQVRLVTEPMDIVNINTPEALSAYASALQGGRKKYLSQKAPSSDQPTRVAIPRPAG